ncbi:hypothetical protein CEP51_016666 [Fusarium floridanum]|uniref:Uncharacterized protein n=1 Tax=Fusarium floridanum TaxID=1325733 RepID=A0A428NIT0_9HYPO|nr:hypothetical protein CEP51_016666 [Fusarium floridanum]
MSSTFCYLSIGPSICFFERTRRDVYETKSRPDTCELCSNAEKKQRQSDKMNCDVERWQRDGTREATAERPCDEMLALMKVEYEERSSLPRLGHVQEASRAETNDAPGSKRVQHLAARTVTMARQDNFGRSVYYGAS